MCTLTVRRCQERSSLKPLKLKSVDEQRLLQRSSSGRYIMLRDGGCAAVWSTRQGLPTAEVFCRQQPWGYRKIKREFTISTNRIVFQTLHSSFYLYNVLNALLRERFGVGSYGYPYSIIWGFPQLGYPQITLEKWDFPLYIHFGVAPLTPSCLRFSR